jgi:type I restriction enzyme, S subunit
MATKDGKTTSLVPRLRFPEFRDLWQDKTIGDFLVESRIPGSDGFVAKKITVKLWGKGVYEKVEALKGSENTNYYKRRAGQFIYSKLDFLNQAFGIIPPHLDGFESTVDLPCFDVSDKLDARFLLEYVQRPDFYKKHGDMADGGRKAKRIQVESFLSFPLAVPSPSEQRKIAACLTSLDALIAARGRKLEELAAHKKGLMQQLFPRPGERVPRLRFPEFRKQGEWEGAELADVAQRVTKRNTNLEHSRVLTNSAEFGVIDQGDFFDREITTKTNLDGYYIVEQGDFVYNPRVSVTAPVGPVSRNNLGVGVMSPLYTVFRFGTKETDYFAHLFKTTIWHAYLKGASNSGARHDRMSISTADFMSLPIPIPPPAEQQRIAACLGSLDAALAAEAQALSALRTHKKGLMQQLFPKAEGD